MLLTAPRTPLVPQRRTDAWCEDVFSLTAQMQTLGCRKPQAIAMIKSVLQERDCNLRKAQELEPNLWCTWHFEVLHGVTLCHMQPRSLRNHGQHGQSAACNLLWGKAACNWKGCGKIPTQFPSSSSRQLLPESIPSITWRLWRCFNASGFQYLSNVKHKHKGRSWGHHTHRYVIYVNKPTWNLYLCTTIYTVMRYSNRPSYRLHIDSSILAHT